jgi:O-antigen ligase
MLFVVCARKALMYIPVMLALFAPLHLNRSAMLALFAAVVVTIILVWSTSPYLRNRVADIATEYHAYESNTVASTAQRLEFWVKSIRFVAAAPLFGHGTGSTRLLLARDAVGQTGLRAEESGNPHNQTLNVAVQWEFIGIIVLYGILLSHLRLFRGDVLGVDVAGGMSRGSKSAKTQKPDQGPLTRTLKQPTVGSASEPATARERLIHPAADR